MMHKNLRSKGLTVDRETVRFVLRELDPEGVESRAQHRLHRRLYTCLGPNYTWHLDGYDKLKQFGFPIHACIDGYSRKILWLRVSETNNDPKVVASFYVNYVKETKFTARLIRTDRGSENVNICGIQRFFRRLHPDSFAHRKSFQYGTSTANQRIEAWWSQLKRGFTHWWIDFFKDMVDNALYDPSLNHHLECARFCFTGVLQQELDEFRTIWNTHRIRHVHNSECPAGKPDLLYNSPQRYGGRDSSFDIMDQDLDLVTDDIVKEPLMFGCSEDCERLSRIIMREHNLSYPQTVEEAKNLFQVLVDRIDHLTQ